MSNQHEHLNILDLSFVDIARKVKEEGVDVILIPIGSCEKHGPHLPLGVDSYITIAVVERAARRSNVFYTPLMPFGYSPHHMGECDQGTGTVTLSARTFRAVLYDIARSLIFHGFNKLIYVSHHGSNTKPIDEVTRRIRYETGAFVAWYKTPTERELNVLADILEGPPEETPGWHSGELETSTTLALRPDTVVMERAKQDRAHAPRWLGPAFSKKDGTGTVIFQGSENIWIPMEHHEYSDIAIIGNPFRASAEKGHRIIERMAEHLSAFVEEVKRIEVKVNREKREFPERA
ncbi:MAG: creatininase family protein [Armatimonadota bacterium]|nr:creatininase family protein [Armatimonadota bacterium]MDR5703273.1 creatininase family protein [Armatimonadota bacterium]MDR7435275.1 creatininase family protein [Armatimonadota bacterium]